MSDLKRIPIREEFTDPQGKFSNFDTYDQAQRLQLANQTHVNVRTFVNSPTQSRYEMINLDTLTMSNLDALTMTQLEGLQTIRQGEQWTGAVTVAKQADRNNWRGLSMTCVPASSYPIAIMSDHPVSYWRLGELIGTVAADSADSNPGTYTGGYTLGTVGPLTGDPDKAVSVNGSSGYVTVLHNSNLAIIGDLTLEAWVKPTDYANYNMILSKYGASDVAPFEWRIDLTTGRPSLLVGNGGTNTGATGTNVIPTGVWSHIAVVVSGSTMTHYLNSVANGSGSIAGQARVDAGNPLTIARRHLQPYFFKGDLDEIAIYNTALSAGRILAHYNAGITTPVNGSNTTTSIIIT